MKSATVMAQASLDVCPGPPPSMCFFLPDPASLVVFLPVPCVPCVSRLPPVSFYRYRYEDS